MSPSLGGPASMFRMMQINACIQTTLLHRLQDDHLKLDDKQGGASVEWLLAHIIQFRRDVVAEFGGHHNTAPPPELLAADSAAALGPRAHLTHAFQQADQALTALVEEAVHRGEGWQGQYPDPTMLLARTLSHDSHHRGQIKSILRLHQVSIPGLNRDLFVSWAE